MTPYTPNPASSSPTAPKKPAQHRNDAIFGEGGVDVVVERTAHQREIRIHRRESATTAAASAARRSSCRTDADVDGRQSGRPHACRLRDRHVNHRRNLVAKRERCRARRYPATAENRIVNDPDDRGRGDPPSGARRKIDGNSQGTAVANEMTDECFIDQQHGRRGGHVARIEISACDDRTFRRCETSRA